MLDSKAALGKAKGLSQARLQKEESYRVQQPAEMGKESDAAQKVFSAQPQQSQSAGMAGSSRSRRLELGTKAELNRAYNDKIQQLDLQQEGQNETVHRYCDRQGKPL